LSAVNKQSENELGHYNISKQRIRKIELWKQKHGEFSTLEDILELDGFGVKVLEKFCDSILTVAVENANEEKPNEDESNLSLMKKKQSYVTPTVLEAFRHSITSCVALHVDLNFIAWTKLSIDPDDETSSIRQISIDDWMCVEIGNEDKKPSLSDLIQILTQLNDRIPTADTYVVEAQPSPQAAKQPGNPIQVNVNVQKAQLIAMMCMMMASRTPTMLLTEKKKPVDFQRIFLLRTYLASRLYKVYIGNERVSTEHVVEDIFRYNFFEEKPTNPTLSAIEVPKHIRDAYNAGDKVDREFMGQSLLVGLTFLKLCVLKCSQSIRSLNKRSNQKVD
jgi:transcription elongation factor, mitochondrial